MFKRLIISTVVCLGVACGDAAETNPSSRGSGTRCAASSDCPSDFVCLDFGAGGLCTPTCEASANACGAQAQCSGVGVMSVEVCQEPTGNETPKPQEQPRMPCSSDADCQLHDTRAICAEFQGRRDCTLPCQQEPDCTPPPVAGVTMDFLTCIPDQGDASRQACLPDERCMANPASCLNTGDFCVQNGLLPCGDFGCYPSDAACDGFPDCADGSDERDCEG